MYKRAVFGPEGAVHSKLRIQALAAWMVVVLAAVAGCTAITSTGEHEFASTDGDRNIPSQNGCLVNASGSCTLAPHDGAVRDGELPMDGGPDASGTGGAGGRGGESAA